MTFCVHTLLLCLKIHTFEHSDRLSTLLTFATASWIVCSIFVSFVIPQILWCVQGYNSFSNGQTYNRQDPNCKNSKWPSWYLLLLSFPLLKQRSYSAPVKVFQPLWQHCSLYVMILRGVTLVHIQLFSHHVDSAAQAQRTITFYISST